MASIAAQHHQLSAALSSSSTSPKLQLDRPSQLLSSCSSQAFFIFPNSVFWRRARTKQRLASSRPLPSVVRAAVSNNGGGGGYDDDAMMTETLNGAQLDRRHLLLAAGMAPSLLLPPRPAFSSPVQPPNLKICTTPLDVGNGAPSVDCCLPVSTTITDFKLPTNLPMRTRLPAHQVPSSYVAKYNKAYELLRALPANDPRQYAQQANVHCAFCDAAYDQNGTQIDYQVHNSWLFFPWHRWYLYFHERILATLLNDDSFALPFWNWDAASGYTIPPMYNDSSSPLYDANRNPLHRPPALVDLQYSNTDTNNTTAAQLAVNNTTMYRQMVTSATTPSLFFGLPYRQGDNASPGGGTIENGSHGTVHVWTGNPSNPNGENMGSFYSAGRDPIFYAHHSNVDRLWEVWKTLGGRRQDITDPDYLNATFLFYDENAKLVRVKIGDALDTTKLAYKYENVANQWLKAAPTATKSRSGTAVREKLKGFKADLKEFKERASGKIEKKARALVKRPKKVRVDDFDEEILVLEGVEVASNEKIKFDVYINLVDDDDDDDKVGQDASEYAGSFVSIPQRMKMTMGEEKSVRKTKFRIGIGAVLKELGIEDDDDFAITIVPRGKPSVPISIASVTIEYE